jgi:polar amino acid transport system substrate-binding protein
MRFVPVTVLVAAALAVTACAPQESTSAADPTGGPCSPDQLQTLEPGTLTLATDPTAYEPWMVGNDPVNQQGYESAVAYAVADELGYASTDVTWTRVPFNAALQPGDKPFDFDINQFAITDERAQVADFSSPYYTVTQVVVATTDSPAAGVTKVADLRGLRLGAQAGTAGFRAVTDVIKPDSAPIAFDTRDEATLALQNGQVDAIVVDLPAAFSIVSAVLSGGVLVGQVPDSADPADQFGLLLEKGSPITSCVSQAVDALQADGTLAKLEKQFLSDPAHAPVLR